MRYRYRSLAMIVSATLLVPAGTASLLAAQVGSVEEGRRLARESCSQCHLLGDETGRSTHEKAWPFRVIANTPGITSAALKVILVTPHRHMPALIIKGEEADSIVAYIISLKDRE
jgi:mono/diheme cytochrome c family protein